MNERLDIRLDKQSFFAWVQDRQGRYELRNGRIVMHPGVSRDHWPIVTGFVIALNKLLPPDTWTVGPADFAVEVGDNVRYPDVVVEAAGGDGKALSTANPIILVEVLSPSSAGMDFTEKVAEYTSLSSLEAYIVASQDEAICWVWQREPDGNFPRLPEEIGGRDKSIELTARGVALPLAVVYRGIGAASIGPAGA